MTIREQLQEKLEKGQIDPLTFLKANIQLTGVEEKVELIKGGEGSKGGKIIGHTRSGKAIYAESRHESHDEFNGKDHADAANLHQRYGVHAENDHEKYDHSRHYEEHKKKTLSQHNSESISHADKNIKRMHCIVGIK